MYEIDDFPTDIKICIYMFHTYYEQNKLKDQM